MTPGSDDSGIRLNAVDILNLVVILLLTLLVAYFRHTLGEQAIWLAALLASLLLFVVLSAVFAERRPIWRVMHDFSPVPIIPVVFNAIGPVIEAANPVRWDAALAALDVRCFGAFPALWRNVLLRPSWLTDVASVAYCGYYVAPVVLAVVLYGREPKNEFHTLVFTVLFTFYASYVGYFLFPTVGPRPPMAAEQSVIGGGGVSQAVRGFINFAERNRTDAFPSGHTAGGIICLYFAWRLGTLAFAVYIPVVAGIIFATVYLHYHYVIDVLFGAALAGACAWLGPRLEPRLTPREVVKRLTVRLGLR